MKIPSSDFEKGETYWQLLLVARMIRTDWDTNIRRAWYARYMSRRLGNQPNYHGMCYAYRQAAKCCRSTLRLTLKQMDNLLPE